MFKCHRLILPLATQIFQGENERASIEYRQLRSLLIASKKILFFEQYANLSGRVPEAVKLQTE